MPNLVVNPLHLGLGATAIPLPEFTGGMAWYEAYGKKFGDEGAEGRLVSMHHFENSWDEWEMHPHGHEVVLCISGMMTILQEMPDGSAGRVVIGPGEYAINAPGVWHTADIGVETTAVFITAGLGTQGRPR